MFEALRKVAVPRPANPLIRTLGPALALVALSAVTAAPGASPGGPGGTAGPEWSIQATMTEACQCRLFCPCTFLDKPTVGHCDDTLALLVTRGHYGDIPLDGQPLVVVSSSQEGKRMVDTVGDLAFADIYVSDRSTEAQRSALVGLVKTMLGADKGKGPRISGRDRVHTAPIEISVSGDHHVVMIPGVLNLESDPIESNATGKAVTVDHAPAFPPFFSPLTVRRSKIYRYTADGRDWKYDGLSADSATFEVDSRTLAGMAQPGESPILPKPKNPGGKPEEHSH